MPITFTEYFKLDKSGLIRNDFFDCILDVDSKYFINFQLLRDVEIPELRTSYQRIQDRFRKIIKLLIESKNNNDIFFRRALELIKFNEVPGTCLGYSSKTTQGSGIGGVRYGTKSRYQYHQCKPYAPTFEHAQHGEALNLLDTHSHQPLVSALTSKHSSLA